MNKFGKKIITSAIFIGLLSMLTMMIVNHTNAYGEGPDLLKPENNSMVPCSIPIVFLWTPGKSVEYYRFELSEGPIDTSRKPYFSIMVRATEQNPSYEYKGELKCGMEYYWFVQGFTPGAQSPVFRFKTETQPDLLTSMGITTWYQLGRMTGIILLIAGAIVALYFGLLRKRKAKS